MSPYYQKLREGCKALEGSLLGVGRYHRVRLPRSSTSTTYDHDYHYLVYYLIV